MDLAGTKKFLRSTFVDFLFRLIAIGALVVAGVASLEAERLSQCQLSYNDYVIQRTKVLAESTDQERRIQQQYENAQSDLLLDPAALKPQEDRTAEEKARLAQKGLGWIEADRQRKEARATADAARANNPVPLPPSEICKG